MAQKGQSSFSRAKALKNRVKPLNHTQLRDLALRYVSRYATTRHKLKAYLHRKLRERDWSEEQPPDIEPMIEKFVDLGYIDDALYAKSRAADLTARGYGKRRVTQALYQAGIAEGDDTDALQLSDAKKWEAASIYARKKSIGPFALEQHDPDKRRKQLQAFLRAGHDFAIASRFVSAAPGETIDEMD